MRLLAAVKAIGGCADTPNPVSMCSVKRLLNLFGIFLALAWVPITSHCAWENLPGLQFFQCATDTEQDSDCEGDSCAQVESASYKVSETQTSIPVPPFTVLFQISLLELLPTLQPLPVTAAPPEIPKGWQFSFRTALRPRAPSFVS
jgi:hypothetical protein